MPGPIPTTRYIFYIIPLAVGRDPSSLVSESAMRHPFHTLQVTSHRCNRILRRRIHVVPIRSPSASGMAVQQRYLWYQVCRH
jgi:hypothetical protein